MGHPWECVPLEDYENHMKLEHVGQLHSLNELMGKQLNQYEVTSAAILGVAGGNGLEHVNQSRLKTVYGVDINQEYLDVCRDKYPELRNCLVLVKADLSDRSNRLPAADLVIANLFIEYVGLDAFIDQISAAEPKYVSCVVQQSMNDSFVSESPYAKTFDGISAIHCDIDAAELKASMEGIGYREILSEIHPLPNGKQFVRRDFGR